MSAPRINLVAWAWIALAIVFMALGEGADARNALIMATVCACTGLILKHITDTRAPSC
jgi:hypothetical protein